MYYLRKLPERKIFDVKKTDGTTIHNDYITDDIALYKDNSHGRFYRRDMDGKNKGMKLYKCKKMSTILQKREILYNYCKEWFEVYDENGKVKLENDD